MRAKAEAKADASNRQVWSVNFKAFEIDIVDEVQIGRLGPCFWALTLPHTTGTLEMTQHLALMAPSLEITALIPLDLLLTRRARGGTSRQS